MTGFSLIGQQQAIELLQQALKANCIAPAYLFTGPLGIGRSLMAKSFTQELICHGVPPEQQAPYRQRAQDGNHPDVLSILPTYLHQGQLLTAQEAEAQGLKRKAPPQIRIEQIREIAHFLSHPPLEACRSVVVIEEAQTMTEGAANALLKTLEEPGIATLLLIAPSTDSLLPTLVSRCHTIPFYRLSQAETAQILEQTGHKHILEHPELMEIAQGSPGEAIIAYELWQTIPEGLRNSLTHLPSPPLKLLELAKIISQELETETQLWLVDYLQYYYWHNHHNQRALECLEKTKQTLLSYVQSRLVWEWTLLELGQN